MSKTTNQKNVLWYNKPAPRINENSPSAHLRCPYPADEGWERYSLPIGNGYFGASIFGRCDVERIQITEKTLENPPTLVRDNVTYFVGGLDSLSETYIDLGHTKVKDYKRYLDIDNAISGVSYKSGRVRYTREYFASYPHGVLVIRLDADKAGKLDFTLRPTIPYLQSFGGYEGDGVSKRGEVVSVASGSTGAIELSGSLDYYGIDFVGVYRLYTKGGSVEAVPTEHKYTDKDGCERTCEIGTLKVKGATSAYVIASFASDYELSSELFTSDERHKPMLNTTLDDARAKVKRRFDKIDEEAERLGFDSTYNYLKREHIRDYRELFARASLDLTPDEKELKIPTDKLLANYKEGRSSRYLEQLLFQYGRYLLIASSRKGALPANLQGAWNTYNVPPWACGYWHNINVQMNYWHAFSTNLAETFEAYADYNAAYMEQAKLYADELIREHNPDAYGKDGGNGWVIGTDGYQVRITPERSSGNLGFTTQLFFERYLFTRDRSALECAYRLLVDAARYITKCVESDGEGKLLVPYCDSPEMHVDGVWYRTKGTAYAQAFTYANNYNALLAAAEMGIDLNDSELLSSEEYSVLKTVMEQIDKYDPVRVGLSGQIKEFREEDYYCSLGDEYHHRHISQLAGLYPANIITANTPAWLDAAGVSLDKRGNEASGWGLAYRLNARARTKMGDAAYETLSVLIKKNTAENLWNLHPPFQIDGSFGLTAGVAEMLLQSHEGYIAPLAAMPGAWHSGSYRGMIARGGFEVSASWAEGLATEFKITSRHGGALKLCYPGIESVRVKKLHGKRVKYTVIGKGLIEFESEPDATYIINGFKEIENVLAPASLVCGREAGGRVRLSFDKVKGAVGYNVYVAEESAPTYTHLGKTGEQSFVCEVDSSKRYTFAVTAVGKSGVESERTLCYRNPRILTEYGIIPADSANTPFALFKSHGEKYGYVGSCESFAEALVTLSKIRSGSCVIYLTRDCKLELTDVALISKIGEGSLTIDLGGRALTLGGELLALGGAKNLSVRVINGRLLTAEGSAVTLLGESSGADVTFEKVYLARARYCGAAVPLVYAGESASGKVSLTFTDCTVDYLNNPEPKQMAIIDLEKADKASIDISFVSGEFRARSFDKLEIYRGREEHRPLFKKDGCGSRTSFKLLDCPLPELSFRTENRDGRLTLTERYKVHHSVYCVYGIVDD